MCVRFLNEGSRRNKKLSQFLLRLFYSLRKWTYLSSGKFSYEVLTLRSYSKFKLFYFNNNNFPLRIYISIRYGRENCLQTKSIIRMTANIISQDEGGCGTFPRDPWARNLRRKTNTEHNTYWLDSGGRSAEESRTAIVYKKVAVAQI